MRFIIPNSTRKNQGTWIKTRRDPGVKIGTEESYLHKNGSRRTNK